jgi:hypothetical protein
MEAILNNFLGDEHLEEHWLLDTTLIFMYGCRRDLLWRLLQFRLNVTRSYV